MTKISIITINYNNSKGLQRTLQSVTSQTFHDYEYIVIDGNSTDESVDIIKQYADKITQWKSEPDLGIYNAMNKGIKLSSGEYLLFLNSGDELFSNDSLSGISQQLHGEEIIYTNLIVRDNKKEYIAYYPDKLSFEYFIDESLPHPATFIKKELFERAGYYDENFKICSDWAFFIIAICRFNASYKHIATELSIFYFDGISSSDEYADTILAERKIVIDRDFPLFVNVYSELLKAKTLLQHINDSRLLKLARKFGMIKQIIK